MSADEPTLIQDHEATLRMPRPGGQATVVMPRSPDAAQAGARSARVDLQRLVAGVNPLLAAAGDLLALVSQLRATTLHADPAGLRQQLLQAIADFEAMAAGHGVSRPQIGAARYLLCSFLDEVIAQTPWGAHRSDRTLLQEFHEERSGSDKVFQLLERLGQEPALNADLLELFYVCLQLGFEGRYRGVPQGRAQLDAIAARLLEVIRPPARAEAARTLSIHWTAATPPARPGVAVLPLWVLGVLGGGVLVLLLLALNARLDAQAQPVLRQLLALPAAVQAPAASAAARPRLAALLKADIAAGAVEVQDEVLRSVVRLPADRLFVSGSATVQSDQAALIAHIARALKDAPGQVAVIGHTDGSTVSSLQHPSNWHLSRARAQAVHAALLQQGLRPERLRFEGRGDVEPLVSGADRARNRRIEIEWRLPRPEQ
jgi:type VI secretion system protein ImpK